jgi:hypothetical protein
MNFKKMVGACLLLLPLTGWAVLPAKENAPASGKETSQTTQMVRGLFGIEHVGDDWYFNIPDSLMNRRFLVTVRYTSTPANTGNYGGEQVGQQTVYWQTAPSNRLMLRSELLFNAADSVDAINRAVQNCNTDPIIGSFKLESHKNHLYRIKVTEFFNEDNAALGLTSRVKTSWGLQGYVPSASYIESIKTFPQNTEIRTVKTWSAQSYRTEAGTYTGRVTLGLNVSFVLLPEIPMQRRFFDPRVGYFTDYFTYYSDHQQAPQTKRFITRWRLEPKDSADAERMKRGELVEPKKPIVYYIDPATPKQWRPYLIQGVEDWQKAFEEAGFKNAIQAREWPENDSTMSMEDARYSVIRYLASPIPNAYGPQVHDPRSGEILESHICWYHNVMTLTREWYMIQAGTLDEAARSMNFDEQLMGELIRFVSSHEVGHTLGLRHNFGSSSTVPVDSLRNKAWVEAHGHTPSIMDYARFNYVAQPEDSISRVGIFPRIGDYDKWAIRWGYTPMWNAYDDESDHWELEKMTSEALAGNRRLWFGDGETNTTNDSRCQTEDLGDDAVKAGEYGIRNLRRIITQIPQWTYQSNDIYNTNASELYNQLLTQFSRYLMHAKRNIGGVYKDFKTVDQQGEVYVNVTKEKQKEVLDFLDRHILTEPTWLIQPSYVSRLTPDVPSVTGRIGRRVVQSLMNSITSLNTAYPAEEFLPDVINKLFRETSTGASVSSYRRSLQACAVESLCSQFAAASGSDEERPVILRALRELRTRLSSAGGGDSATRAHNASLIDTIDRTLVVK